ncbi:MAG: response regulator transcription factor [bacterium]
MPERIRILLADDHTIVRKGICAILNSQGNMEVIGEAGNGREAVEMAQKLLPDVVVMDIVMPRLNGLEATRQIKKQNPNIGVLVLTAHEGEEHIFQALRAGATGYLLKRSDVDELLLAIRAVSQGKAFLSPLISKSIVESYIRWESSHKGDAMDRLTGREREVLQLVAEGYLNKEIASAMGLSVKTIEAHIRRVMNKLNIRDRIGLVKYAIRKGLIDLN